PHGLILHIERQPIKELDPGILEKDQDYWRKYVGKLLGDWLNEKTTVEEVCAFARKVYHRRDLTGFTGDEKFVADTQAQKAFSKLRSSIGGVYAWRISTANSDAERQRMTSAADLAFRQALALCPYSPEAVFRYINLLLPKRLDDAVIIARTCRTF